MKYALPQAFSQSLVQARIPIKPLLVSARVPVRAVDRHRCELGFQKYLSLWQLAERQLGPEPLALLYGEQVEIKRFEPALLAFYSCLSLGEAIERFAQIRNLSHPVQIRVETRSNGMSIGLESPVIADKQCGLVAAEQLFLINLARFATGQQIQPAMVSMINLPIQASRFREVCGVRITPGEPRINLSVADARLPLMVDNEAFWNLLLPDLGEQVRQLEYSGGLSRRVQAVLMQQLLAGKSDIDDSALALQMNSRTLQRKLAAENSSFSSLVADLRAAMARLYLLNTDCSLSEISVLLAYADINGFIRAFKTWYGHSPAKYRRQRGQDMETGLQQDWISS